MKNEENLSPCSNKDCVNLLELIHHHMEEYYDKDLTPPQLHEVFWLITDTDGLSNTIYDAAMKYADQNGWKMTM